MSWEFFWQYLQLNFVFGYFIFYFGGLLLWATRKERE